MVPSVRQVRGALPPLAQRPAMPVLRCACGGVVERPIPVRCPHCGARIQGVRKRVPLALLLIPLMFAALMAFAYLWLGP
jgi:hypothetical protein